jgi:hypothetical protein
VGVSIDFLSRFESYRLLDTHPVHARSVTVEFREYDMLDDEDFIGPNYLAVNENLKEQIRILGS